MELYLRAEGNYAELPVVWFLWGKWWPVNIWWFIVYPYIPMKMCLFGRQSTVSTCLILSFFIKTTYCISPNPLVNHHICRIPHIKKEHVDVTPLLSQTHMAVSSFVSAHLSTFAPRSNMKSTGPLFWLEEPCGGKTCQETPVTCFTTRRSTEV